MAVFHCGTYRRTTLPIALFWLVDFDCAGALLACKTERQAFLLDTHWLGDTGILDVFWLVLTQCLAPFR